MRNSIKKNPVMEKAMKKAVKLAGGPVKLAEAINKAMPGEPCTRQAVSAWAKRGMAPSGRVLTLEKITGIPKSEFRPDLYREE